MTLCNFWGSHKSRSLDDTRVLEKVKLSTMCVPARGLSGRVNQGEMVGRIGFEPMTNGLKIHCSTD